jgi:hypothetical protein
MHGDIWIQVNNGGVYEGVLGFSVLGEWSGIVSSVV